MHFPYQHAYCVIWIVLRGFCETLIKYYEMRRCMNMIVLWNSYHYKLHFKKHLFGENNLEKIFYRIPIPSDTLCIMYDFPCMALLALSCCILLRKNSSLVSRCIPEILTRGWCEGCEYYCFCLQDGEFKYLHFLFKRNIDMS